MPAYSFQERFVPFVIEGSKPQTIRKRRNQKIEPGSILYLYFGMRTKYCRKLREEVCTDVRTISISKKGHVFLCGKRLSNADFDLFINKKLFPFGYPLCDRDKDQLAWLDGFRPEGTTLVNASGSFDLMLRWWKQTHGLPFYGDIIYWKPKKN